MKKRSLCFKYGSFSAALLALALGMASCHLEKKWNRPKSCHKNGRYHMGGKAFG